MTISTLRKRVGQRVATEEGFTLIELLAVVLIIGILAAIALPAFVEQRIKGQDASAKTDVRNIVSHMEACFTEEESYVGCTARMDPGETGLDIGPGPGQVRVTNEGPSNYTIVATSKGQTGGVYHTFTIAHSVGAPYDHDCTVRGEGGCPLDGDW